MFIKYIIFFILRLSNRPCYCKYHSICDTYQQSITNKDTDASNSIENPSKCELDNVHKVYNEIANHFSETRHSPWPQVADFLKRFQTGSILVDIGCGNGKYLDTDYNTFKVCSLENFIQTHFCFKDFFLLLKFSDWL